MRCMKAVLLSVFLCVGLTGCTATSALKAVTGAIGGGQPDLTAQVGATNTKQGIGATVSTEDKNETTVKDSTVGTVDSSKDQGSKANNITTGSITAERIIVKNSDPADQIWSFAVGGVLMLAGLGLFAWAFLKHRKDKASATET